MESYLCISGMENISVFGKIFYRPNKRFKGVLKSNLFNSGIVVINV